MSSRIGRLACFALALSTVTVHAQVNRIQQVAAAQAQVNKVLEDSGKHFRDGMFALKEGRRSESGEKFDKSVEVFLMSTLNVQADQKLQTCYSNLIETVYRMEFPAENQLPQLRGLSAACGWTWNAEDMKLADQIAALVKPAPMTQADRSALAAVAPSAGGQQTETRVGFNSQQFDPSSLDELSKVESYAPEGLRIYFGDNDRSKKPSRVVKARAGDTVAKLATREKADPTEVAKYNGLLPNSVLGAGREIRIREDKGFPSELNTSYLNNVACKVEKNPVIQKLSLGMSPAEVSIVLKRRLVFRNSLYTAKLSYAIGLPGTTGILLQFYRSKLIEIVVVYDGSINWENDTEFRSAITSGLSLPKYDLCSIANVAIYDAPDGRLALLATQNSLLLLDTAAYNQLIRDWSKDIAEKQRKVEEESRKKKANFKP